MILYGLVFIYKIKLLANYLIIYINFELMIIFDIRSSFSDYSKLNRSCPRLYFTTATNKEIKKLRYVHINYRIFFN